VHRSSARGGGDPYAPARRARTARTGVDRGDATRRTLRRILEGAGTMKKTADNYEAEVSRLRDERARLLEARPAIERTRVPYAVAVARVELHIATDAARVERLTVVGFTVADYSVPDAERYPLLQGDVGALLCKLFPDQVKALVCAELDRYRKAHPADEL